MKALRCAMVLLFAAAVSANEGFILSVLKNDAKPCDDFYETVCSSWIENRSISLGGEPYGNAQESFWKEVEEILNDTTSDEDVKLSKMKVAYQGCINHKRKQGSDVKRQLRELLRKLGIPQWPMSQKSKKRPGWMDLFVNISTTVDLSVLLDITVKPDEKDTSSYAITVKMPNLGIAKEVLLEPEPSERKRAALEAYKSYIDESIRLLTSSGKKSDSSKDIVDLETELAQISDPFWYEGPSLEELGNTTIDYSDYNYDESSTEHPQDTYTTTEVPDVDITNVKTAASKTVRDLSTLAPGINWQDLLSKLFGRASKDISEEDKVVLDDKTYYSRLSGLLNTTDQSVLTNYFGWRVVQTIGPLIHSGLADARQKFDKAMNKSQRDKSRREMCLQEFAGEYGTARELIGRLYAKKHLSNDAKTRVETIAEDIKQTYERILKNSSWLSETTRKNELYKLSMMQAKVGYAEQLMDDTYIRKAYQWMDGIKPDMPLLDIISMFRAKRRLNELMNAGEDYNRCNHIGFVSPTALDQYYSPQDNSFVFPAVTLQRPFYDRAFPNEMLIGLLGWGIARVMTYGLDLNGGWFGGDGALLDQNYWSSKSKTEQANKRKCFNLLYNNNSPGVSESFDRRSLRADIADNVGLDVAFKALGTGQDCSMDGMNGYTRNQIFFISAGVGMCLNMREILQRRPEDASYFSSARERLNFPLGNMPEFAQAFNCNDTHYMKFKKTCSFW